MKRSILVLAAVAAGACTPDNGPTMRPGEDCLRCHGGSTATGAGDERHATPWSLAGTVYPSAGSSADAGIEGVDIQVSDAAGFTFVLHSNLVGNFYSAESVAYPLRVCVARNGATRCMEEPSENGACNSCHTPEEAGRIFAP